MQFLSAERLWHRSNVIIPTEASPCAKIQRTHKSISRRMTGFPLLLAMATGFAALGRSSHGDSIFLWNRAQQRKFLARLRRNFSDAEYAQMQAINTNRRFGSSWPSGAHFSRHAQVSTPGQLLPTSNVRISPRVHRLSCSVVACLRHGLGN